MLLALWRALRGPSAQDRVLAVDFVTIVAMMLMLVVGIRYGSSKPWLMFIDTDATRVYGVK